MSPEGDSVTASAGFSAASHRVQPVACDPAPFTGERLDHVTSGGLCRAELAFNHRAST